MGKDARMMMTGVAERVLDLRLPDVGLPDGCPPVPPSGGSDWNRGESQIPMDGVTSLESDLVLVGGRLQSEWASAGTISRNLRRSADVPEGYMRIVKVPDITHLNPRPVYRLKYTILLPLTAATDGHRWLAPSWFNKGVPGAWLGTLPSTEEFVGHSLIDLTFCVNAPRRVRSNDQFVSNWVATHRRIHQASAQLIDQGATPSPRRDHLATAKLTVAEALTTPAIQGEWLSAAQEVLRESSGLLGRQAPRG
jgi:hypothetical protein